MHSDFKSKTHVIIGTLSLQPPSCRLSVAPGWLPALLLSCYCTLSLRHRWSFQIFWYQTGLPVSHWTVSQYPEVIFPVDSNECASCLTCSSICTCPLGATQQDSLPGIKAGGQGTSINSLSVCFHAAHSLWTPV